MFQKLEGLKTTLWSGLIVSLIVVAILYLQEYLIAEITFIEQVLVGILAIGIVFTAQFSRSRFTILILIFSLFKTQTRPN